ncbi:MAG: XRE family transcriptional regulator [Lysobacter sp.]|nr:MAG: XRE family transcriptional regulator [Lysobacter sp.]
MTDTTPFGAAGTLVALDGSRLTVSLSPADAAVEGALAPVTPGAGWPAPPCDVDSAQADGSPPQHPPESGPGPGSSASPPPVSSKRFAKGSVFLRAEVLRFLRHQKLLSQQDMADDASDRNIRLSIATIKRAELGVDAARYRTAREFARYFGVAVELLLRDRPE